MQKRSTLTATVLDGDEPRTIQTVGRFAQTLKTLVESGPRGVTALEVSTWALRLAHYVHILRRQYGLNIEMKREPHDGGWHGRYILRSPVRIEGGCT